MSISEQQVADWKEQRQRLIDDVTPLERGEMQLGENRGHGWIDITPAAIERTRRSIATYEAMIAEGEKAIGRRS